MSFNEVETDDGEVQHRYTLFYPIDTNDEVVSTPFNEQVHLLPQGAPLRSQSERGRAGQSARGAPGAGGRGVRTWWRSGGGGGARASARAALVGDSAGV